MTKATPVMASLDHALAAKIDAENELDLLKGRLAEEQQNLGLADLQSKQASLAAARSGSIDALAAEREALAHLAAVERMVSNLADRLIPEAETALIKAERAVAEARRTACADEAETECEAVARRLAEEYPELIQRLADLKAAVAAADAKRAEANRDLPDGRTPLWPVEARVRDTPGQRVGEVSREVVSVWCYAGTLNPISEDRLGDITATSRPRHLGGGSGHVLASRSRNGNNHPVELRRLVRVTMQDAQQLVRGPRLSDMVLPPLRPDAPDCRQWTELREPTPDDLAAAKAGGEGGEE